MLQKGFLRNRTKPNISKKRFWTSVAVGLGASFSIYTFLCFINLSFGLLDFGTANYALVKEPAERYWENFNFALIALVLGNALFLLNIFRKPDKNPVPGNVRLAIINEQRFLQFNFSYLLLKLGFFVAYISTFVETRLSENKFILAFVAIVVFLESWKSIIKYYKRIAYKPLLLSFSIILTLAFCLAFTSVFQYKKIEAFQVNTNPFVDLPISDFADDDYMYFREIKLKIYEERNHLLYNFEGRNIEDFNQLKSVLQDSVPILYRIEYGIVLLMPKDISIASLVKLETFLFDLGYRRIRYVTRFANEELVSRYDMRGLVKRLNFIGIPDSIAKIPLPPESTDSVVSKTIQVYLGEKEYVFENEKVNKNELVEYFVKHIDSSTQFNYVLDESITYQSYITLLASQKQAVQDLRYNDQKVELKFRENFWPVNRKEYEKDRDRLLKKFPLLITETYIE